MIKGVIVLQKERVRILGIDIDNIDIEEAGSLTKELVDGSNKSCKMVFGTWYFLIS